MADSTIGTLAKLLTAVPDVLKSVSQLYVQGRTSLGVSATSAASSDLESSLLNGTSGGSSIFQTSGSEDYKSVSGAQGTGKPFIIGLIAPDVQVNFVPVERNQTQLADITTTPATTGSAASGTAQINTVGVTPAGGLPDSFYQALTKVAQAIGASPADLLLVLFSESGLNPASENHVDNDKSKPVQARGLNQITPVACAVSGMSKDFWANGYSQLSAEQQLPYVQRYFKGCYSGPYVNATQLYIVNFAPAFTAKAADPNAVLYPKNNPDGSINNNWAQNKGINPNGDITAGDMGKLVNKNIDSGGYKAQLARLKAVVGDAVATSGPASANGVDPGNTIANAADAKGQAVGAIMQSGNITDAEGDDPLNQVGRNIKVSDQRQAIVAKQTDELNKQIAVAQSIPGLLMLINPQDFTRNFEHQIDTPKGRRGPIVHMWLEKPLSISCKGTTAAQYVMDGLGNGGLTNENRLHSLSYANLMSLVLLYRNNGHLYTQAPAGDSLNWGIPVISMSVFIYYDGHIYIGSFDDFSVTDDAEKPYNLNYSWKFTARYDIDVTRINDQFLVTALSGGSSGPFPSTPTVGTPPVNGVVPPTVPAPQPNDFPVTNATGTAVA